MKCRRCDRELYGSMEEGEEDETSNPSVIVTFQCHDCDLEFIGVYHITQLIAGTIEGGGGEIPLEIEQGRRLFE